MMIARLINKFLLKLKRFAKNRLKQPWQNLYFFTFILSAFFINITNPEIGGYQFEAEILNQLCPIIIFLIINLTFYNIFLFRNLSGSLGMLISFLIVIISFTLFSFYLSSPKIELISKTKCKDNNIVYVYQTRYVGFIGNGELVEYREKLKPVFPGLLKATEPNFCVDD